MNNKSNLISIIVPAYNAEKSIQKTLESIAGQTYKNIEIIVINDASKDKTLEVLQQFAAADSRFIVINLEKNQGVHEARMHGLRASKGQWIGFVDADDYVHSDMYQVMLSNVLENNADIALCSVRRVNEQGKLISFLPQFRKNQVLDTSLLENLTQFKLGLAYLWNRLYSRKIIIGVAEQKFPWRQNLNEDMIINIGCFIKAKRVYLNKGAFYNYVKNISSATATVNKEKAYLEHFRAFALAMHFYGNVSNQVQEAIYSVYRTQLSHGKMHVENTQLLEQFKEEFLAAVQLINKQHPLALVKLASRSSKNCSSFKERVLRVAKKVISKFILKNDEFEFIK